MSASGSPCILNSTSFPTVCLAEYPITWPVSQFHSEVTSPESGLQALLDTPVTDITVYHRPGGPVTHDYMILCLRPADPNALGGLARIWARCERNPGSIPGGAAKLYREAAPALDTIRFSVDRPKLRAEGDNAIMECTYSTLRIAHVADLLRIIHDVSPKYGLASYNCWWFAAVAIGSLQVLDSDWTIQPSKDWAKKLVLALGKSTNQSTRDVTRIFANRWHSGVLPSVDITSVEAWTSNTRQGSYPPRTTPERARQQSFQSDMVHPIYTNSFPPDANQAPLPPIPPRHFSRESTLPPTPPTNGTPPLNAGRPNSSTPPAPIPIPSRGRTNSHAVQANSSPHSSVQDSFSLPPDNNALGIETEGTPPPSYQLLAEDVPVTPEARSPTRLRSNTSNTNTSAGSISQVLSPFSQNGGSSGSSPLPPSSSWSESQGNPMNASPLSYPGSLPPTRPTSASYSQTNLPVPGMLQTTSARGSRVSQLGGAILEEENQFTQEVLDSYDDRRSLASPTSPASDYSASVYSFNPPGPNQQGQMDARSIAPSVYSTVSYPDGETLPALVWRVAGSRDPRDLSILLAIYPSFTTSSDLLHEFKTIFRTQILDERSRWLRARVIAILCTWVSSDDFDTSLGSELRSFLFREVQPDPEFSQSREVYFMLNKLDHLSTNFPDPSLHSVSSVSFQYGSPSSGTSSSRSTKKAGGTALKADSIYKMKDRDLVEIAGALEMMELDMRAQLTVAKVVRWLKWKRTPAAQSATARPFSTISDKIAAWVVDSCLQGSLDHRAQTFTKLVQVAERCRDNGNLATLSDLLYGLRSPAVERLTQTRRLANSADSKIFDLMQMIHPQNPHRIFSLNPRMLAFVGPFNNTILDPTLGLISWSRCKELHDAIMKAVAIPSAISIPHIHPSYQSFLSVHIHAALQNARNHNSISQRIADEEVKEKHMRERSAAGMRVR